MLAHISVPASMSVRDENKKVNIETASSALLADVDVSTGTLPEVSGLEIGGLVIPPLMFMSVVTVSCFYIESSALRH